MRRGSIQRHDPRYDGPEDVEFPLGSYWSLTARCWPKCAMISTVSHSRLDLVLRNGKRHRSEFVSALDMSRVEDGVCFALKLA